MPNPRGTPSSLEKARAAKAARRAAIAASAGSDLDLMPGSPQSPSAGSPAGSAVDGRGVNREVPNARPGAALELRNVGTEVGLGVSASPPQVFFRGSALDLLPADSSWSTWAVFLLALEGRGAEMTPAQVETFRKHTGRSTAPTKPFREAHVVAGRRGGKSAVASAIAVTRAIMPRTWKLRAGETAVVPLIAADREQAKVLLGYVKGLISETPEIAPMMGKPTRTTVPLTNQTRVEVHTANFRLTRGRTLAAVICDETAFWRNEETSTNPDLEIFRALRPGLMTSGGPLIAISSPYARRGVLWEQFKRYFGVDDAPVLIWQATSLEMNPLLPQEDIDRAYEEDPESASAEYGGQFRSDLESYISEEVLTAVTVTGRDMLQPRANLKYVAFVDPSGGGPDSFTLAIAHRDSARNMAILDFVREIKTPFSPEAAVAEIAADLQRYSVKQVVGDHYAGEWPRDAFRRVGIHYEISDLTKSDLYLAAKPLMTSARVELLDVPRMLNQFRALERRTGRSGKDSVDHPPRGKDDISNAVAGALNLVRLLAGSFPSIVFAWSSEFGHALTSAPPAADPSIPRYVKKCRVCFDLFSGTEAEIMDKFNFHWADRYSRHSPHGAPPPFHQLEDAV